MFDSLPPEVQAVLREFRTCEFTTLSKKGWPSTWPVSARFLTDQQKFLLTTSIGLSRKALNIRRNPRVALLFSNPTASGLNNPPVVLVQGDATAPDEIVTSINAKQGLREYWRESIFKRQPPSSAMSAYPITRYLMDWYYMRIVIHVTPRRVSWWPAGDFNQPAQRLEVAHVV